MLIFVPPCSLEDALKQIEDVYKDKSSYDFSMGVKPTGDGMFNVTMETKPLNSPSMKDAIRVIKALKDAIRVIKALRALDRKS